MAYYPPRDHHAPPLWRRGSFALAVAAVHGLALLLAFGPAPRREPPPLPALSVRTIELPPRVEAPKPRLPAPPRTPPPRRPVPAAPPVAQPVLAAAPVVPSAPAPFVVAAQPETRPVPAAQAPVQAAPPAPPAPPAMVPARFDADYLQNPKPAYPAMSRRLGEEGRVVLSVRVSPQGGPLGITVHQSSGHPRLDEAARAAVAGWRFVPARQGSDPVESTVLVPLVFSLDP